MHERSADRSTAAPPKLATQQEQDRVGADHGDESVGAGLRHGNRTTAAAGPSQAAAGSYPVSKWQQLRSEVVVIQDGREGSAEQAQGRQPGNLWADLVRGGGACNSADPRYPWTDPLEGCQ